MLGPRRYQEGQFPPERGFGHNWHVRCATGAMQVLAMRDYETWFEKSPDHTAYTINFANGSCAAIDPEAPLWHALLEVTKTYNVELFAYGLLTGDYRPWDGSSPARRVFDAIKIVKK